MNADQRNLAWADALVAGLAAAGLRRAVLAPGARSAPLALALLRRPEIACEVFTDERVAGYFALGLAKASGQPAAVLCTSGTATANLLPAVMEANLAGVPLLVLTADRPAEALGWGANQTADQSRLYGAQVRAYHALPVPDGVVDASFLRALAARLVEDCLYPAAGPVHANLPFREPLLPEAIPPAPPLPAPIRVDRPAAVVADPDRLAERLSGRPGVILCGELASSAELPPALATLAARLGAPILAEPLSNLRHGGHDRSHVLARQARFLRQPGAFKPAWLLRFGTFPVSRVLDHWLAGLDGCEQILVAPPGRWPDPRWRTDTIVRTAPLAVVAALLHQPLAAAPAEWFDAWRAAEQASESASGNGAEPFFEGTVARRLIEALPDGSHGFVGNSLAIRAMDAYGGTSAKRLTLHGNRGASGIDGNFATAAGIAAGSGAPTAVLLGDQAALHDCGGLAALAGRDVVAVVLDNGGGGIFEHLPLARALPAPLLERGWLAPPRLDFRALAGAFGLAYAEAADDQQLATELARACAAGGAHLLRVVIDRAASRHAWRRQ
jgi:2-succinyl-5-enolpyruvyl-6-hydroxy-3-cyclohexene-1-carboxylate synthase